MKLDAASLALMMRYFGACGISNILLMAVEMQRRAREDS
jgi:hypothetical protein